MIINKGCICVSLQESVNAHTEISKLHKKLLGFARNFETFGISWDIL